MPRSCKVSNLSKELPDPATEAKECKKLANATWRMNNTACFRALESLAIQAGKKPTRKNTLIAATDYARHLESMMAESYGDITPLVLQVVLDALLLRF